MLNTLLLSPLATLVLALASLVQVASPSQQAPALGGLDPVRLCAGEELPGLAEFTVQYGRYTYRFADKAARKTFASEPERYCIQWGGGCGSMGPLSGAGDAQRWAVEDGRIFIFASDGCRASFRKAPERYLETAQQSAPASEAALAEGARWIERALAAHGGAAAIDAPFALRLTETGSTDGWAFEKEQLVTREGQMQRRSTWTPPEPDGAASTAVWGLGGISWAEVDGERFRVTSADQLADLRRFVLREPLALLWMRAREGVQVVDLGAGELDGTPVQRVRLEADGLATTMLLDQQSGRILGIAWRGRLGGGMTRDVVESFSAWQELDGVLLPRARSVALDGEPTDSLAGEWTAVEFLSALPGSGPETRRR